MLVRRGPRLLHVAESVFIEKKKAIEYITDLP